MLYAEIMEVSPSELTVLEDEINAEGDVHAYVVTAEECRNRGGGLPTYSLERFVACDTAGNMLVVVDWN